MNPDNTLTNQERHVVLVAPEVHWNTGNIGRTCIGAGAHLHLIRPLGFSLDSKQVKRAGLDYWEKVPLSVWDNFDAFLRQTSPRPGEVFIFTKNGKNIIWNMSPNHRMFLVFGSETCGLPEKVLALYEKSSYCIPITGGIRCLNLSTSVGIALYESLRPQ